MQGEGVCYTYKPYLIIYIVRKGVVKSKMYKKNNLILLQIFHMQLNRRQKIVNKNNWSTRLASSSMFDCYVPQDKVAYAYVIEGLIHNHVNMERQGS